MPKNANIVQPTVEAFCEIVEGCSPDVIAAVVQEAERRLDRIANLIEQHPYLPATTIEATAEFVIERWPEWTREG